MDYMLNNNRIADVLHGLHREASQEMGRIIRGLAKGVFRKLAPEDMRDAYIAISEAQGQFIYQKVIEHGGKHMVEFGTSFGISTLYLAAAARVNGGKVITTELLENKCTVAQKNFEKAGVDDLIDLRQGNALETLKDVAPEIDFLLLDGWNDLYLPLLKQLEPKLSVGSLIYTDNIRMKGSQPLLQYVRQSPRYRSHEDGLGGELSTYLGSHS
ncbi:MAG: class I SAM-dependent methyltransferase [Saprospiraceae bacterium]|nr:class I SAM-dependent methyltransferase [Saprospiraceae bacterium]